MMKKRILSLAVTAGLVGAASAAQAQMHINEKGLGEALVYPFYSAANGNDTYVHVVNTTSDTKAVKVRFIEAMNSQEVLDFNLYLSPEDVWAGVITKNPNGDGAMIRTVDTSCTVPQLGTSGGGNVGQFAGTTTTVNGKTRRDQPFVNFKYNIATATAPALPESDRSVERTLEGYIEIIEMGQLDPEGPATGAGALPGPMAVHDSTGVPANCGGLVSLWTTGPWQTGDGDGVNTGFRTWNDENTAGGLYGFGVVINVEKGTAVSYDAVAIDNFATSNLHAEPGDESPALEDAQAVASIFNGPTATTYVFQNGTDAVSALFMSTHIHNDYVIDPEINALTDWVVAMPTKRFYVNQGTPYSDPAQPPFARRWNPDLAQACEPIQIQFWDREEMTATTPVQGPQFSPRPPSTPSQDLEICREVAVISFAGENSALNASSRVQYGISPGYNEGWASVSFLTGGLNTTLPADSRTIRDGVTGEGDNVFNGLPVTGFAVFSYQNGALSGGVLANYSAGSAHKSAIRVDDDPLP